MPRTLDRATLLLRRDHTLGTLMDRLERAHGDRQLVTEADGGLSLTYAQAAKRVRRWAGGIAAQVSPGDVVVIATANGYEQLLLCFAASRAGAIPAPVNDQMRREEIDHVVRDSGATLVLRSAVSVDGGAPMAEAHPADAGDVGALFYTSGTTGSPKGAALTHRALVGQAASAALWPTRLHRDEAVIALPVAHIMGFAVLIGLAFAGIPTYLLPKFNPVKVLDAIEQRRATMFVGVPAMYRMLDEAHAAEHDLTSVRVWASGADAMPPGWPSASSGWAPRSRSPCSGPWARRRSPRGTAWSRSGEAWPPRCHPRTWAPRQGCSARRSGSRYPATRCVSSTTRVPRCRAARSASCR